MTKNYPFPVPRIRELSSKFTVASCDEESTPSPTVLDENAVAASPDENKTSIPSIQIIESAANQEPVVNNDESLNHSSNDSELMVVVHNPSRQRTTFNVHSRNNDNKNYDHKIYVPRHDKTHRRFTEHYAHVKSIVVKPPDATQEDVSKARFKLRGKAHTLQLYK